jgi:hypothetical protein
MSTWIKAVENYSKVGPELGYNVKSTYSVDKRFSFRYGIVRAKMDGGKTYPRRSIEQTQK